MRSPLRLLKIIGKAALHISGAGGLWSILVEDVPELANEVWDEWEKARNADERRSDLEELAQLLDDDISLDIDAILDEIATDRPEPVRAELADFLSQIPVSVRQTLRRPADPTGRTVPPAMEPRSARDLIPFLDTQRPRFKRGDRPIPSVDWELVELLGIGGFGEVWKARHAQLEDFEPVALKFCTDPHARERLLKHEAKVCTRVMKYCQHPGIVQLRQAYLSADSPCLEYEYVEGGTLSGLIKEWGHRDPKPSIEEMTRHLLAIAEIVAFAHRLDPPIVHRDLKPANILVQRANGKIHFKITDFGIGGIATIRAIRETRQPTRPSLLITKAVSGSHSPIYASPEQARGDDPDPRDDVHALGVIWYQLLTGDLTAGRPSGSAWKRQLRERNMAPTMLDLLESCFDAAPDRPEDATALVTRLRESLGEVRPVEAKSKPEARVGELCRLSNPKGFTCLAFSPDGDTLLIGGKDQKAYLWYLPSNQATSIDINRPIMTVAFSPDGESYCVAGGSTRKEKDNLRQGFGKVISKLFDGLSVGDFTHYESDGYADVISKKDNSRILNITHNENFSDVRFTVDGSRLVLKNEYGGLSSVDCRSGNYSRSLININNPIRYSSKMHIRLTDDGRHAIFDGEELKDGDWKPVIGLFDIPTGFLRHQAFITCNSVISCPPYHSDVIVVTDQGLERWSLETGRRKAVFPDLEHKSPYSWRRIPLCISQNGNKLIHLYDDFIFLIDAHDGREIHCFELSASFAKFSPDGSRVAAITKDAVVLLGLSA